VYSKPYNLLLALPLGFLPFLPFIRDEPNALLGAAFAQSIRRGTVLAATVLGLFGLNKAVTGEMNYQGGERKTFYGALPFELGPGGQRVTFGNSGIWMTTDYLGPLVEGRDESLSSRRTGPLRPPEEMRASLFRNLGYFWVGRFGGVLAYFFPALIALVTFLLFGPWDAEGWLAAVALLGSSLFYIWMIPDNWYGGGGTVGNRYFLNLLPLGLFLIRRGRAWFVAGAGVFGGTFFLVPVLAAPLHHSLHPGEHTQVRPFRLLPLELTMLNDLSVFTEPWRKKQTFGFMGDPAKHLPADPTAYSLYFLDDGTHGKETYGDEEGFWLRGGREAEIVLRVLDLKPLQRVVIRATGGPIGDVVSCSLKKQNAEIRVEAGETGEATLKARSGFPYYETYLHVLHLRSRAAMAPPDDRGRCLGAFVSLRLEVEVASP
jgi:hypothetical protein